MKRAGELIFYTGDGFLLEDQRAEAQRQVFISGCPRQREVRQTRIKESCYFGPSSHYLHLTKELFCFTFLFFS